MISSLGHANDAEEAQPIETPDFVQVIQARVFGAISSLKNANDVKNAQSTKTPECVQADICMKLVLSLEKANDAGLPIMKNYLNLTSRLKRKGLQSIALVRALYDDYDTCPKGLSPSTNPAIGNSSRESVLLLRLGHGITILLKYCDWLNEQLESDSWTELEKWTSHNNIMKESPKMRNMRGVKEESKEEAKQEIENVLEDSIERYFQTLEEL
ncbi:hypothetical protein K432DRAFT_393640 [Lepidopterella palustris CBS 459.81]|uniref:Uncharacterized protein n=1 Tax=Lepidopterella palustris CBS 459.81 TaxID=1314670 RepID=A0A8E2E9E3_9PEZI|nr:hypothetical protein K432DRAFT_393640 [Lepidopterella palustris CBS 459.81]